MNTLPNTNENLLSIDEASRELKVSKKTLRRWEDKMLLVPMRTLGGHRRYSKAQVEAFKKQRKQKIVSTTPSPASSELNSERKTRRTKKAKFGYALILTGLALFFVLTGKYAVNSFNPDSVKESLNSNLSNIAENIRSKREASRLETFGNKEGTNVLAELTTAEDVQFNLNVEANFNEQITANADISTNSDTFNLINENATTLNIGGAATTISIGEDTGETTVNNTLNANNGFQLGGTAITSTAAELNYLGGTAVTAGGVIYGDGTSLVNGGAGNANEVLISNGTSAPTWGTLSSIGGNFLRSDSSDSYTSGTLDFSDATFLDLSAIKNDDSGLQGLRLPQNTSFTNPSSGEGFLAWNSSTNVLQVYDGTSWTGVTTTGTNKWTGASGVIYAQTLTDNLTLGSANNLAKLGVDGDTDEVQLLVQADDAQTEDVFVVEQSDGTDILSLANDGSGTLTHSSTSNFAINLTSTGDFVIQDAGVAFATFSDNGLFTVDSVTLNDGDITSAGDVTIDPTTNLVFADLNCTGNANGGALTVDASGIVSCSDDDSGGAGANAWDASSGKVYFVDVSDELGIGTSTTSEIISKLYVTSDSSTTGKALAIFNQTEDQELLVASKSGTTKFVLDTNGRLAVGYSSTAVPSLSYPFEVYNEGTTQISYIDTSGNLQIDGDLTVGGGDIDVSGEAANIAIIDGSSGAFTVSQGANEYINITTSDNTESFTLNLPTGGATSQTANLFNSNIAKTINLGVGTAADTINIGTDGSTADVISIGGLATTTIDLFGVTTLGDGGSTNYASFSATGDLTFNGSADTITGPGAGGFTITNTSGNISLVTATAGDVTIGPPTSLGTDDDLIFQDGTLNAAIPLTSVDSSLNTPTSAIIDAINEAYAAATGGTGGAWTLASNVIYPSTLGDRVGIGTTTVGDVIGKLYISSEATNLTGKALAILNQTESEDIFTASASGDSLFSIAASSGDSGEIRLFEEASNGKQYTGFKSPTSLAGDVVYTLPTASAGGADYVLTWQSGDALQWKEVTGVGGAGDITAVGSIGSGIAFASSATADDQWLGIGATEGRIEFDDQSIDEVNIRSAKLGLGTATPTSLFHAETNTNSLTGKSVAILNQMESEDIFTASASGSTKFFIDNNGRVAVGYSNATGGTTLSNPFEVYNEGTTQVASISTAGNLQIDGDLTVSGGDIDISGEAADLSIIDSSGTAFRIVQGTDVYFGIDTTDNQEAFTINLPTGGATSQTANLFTSNIAKTINLGTGTAIDTINIGTGGTGADIINIGSSNAGDITIQSNAVLSLTGSTNSLIDFPNFDVSTAGAITAASNLDINGTTNDIAGDLNLSGNSLTATGDLTIDPAGDDVVVDGDFILNDAFTLQVGGLTATAYNAFADAADTPSSGQLNSDDDLFVGGTLELGESLCFGTDCASNWSSGGASPWSYTSPYLYPDNNTDRVGIGTTNTADIDSRFYVTSPSAIGAALAIFDQTESQDILTASVSGTTRWTLGNDGSITQTVTTTGNTAYTADYDTITTGTGIDLSVDGLTTGTGLLIDDNTAAGLSSGTLLQAQTVTTDTTAITDGLLGYFNWNPGSTTTKTGDLFRINIGSSGNVDNVFNVTDNGSTLFSVGESQITSAVPHSFTAAGDVVIAYDLQFSNQTASYIKSKAPLYLQAGESFESNNLTLQTYNSGNVVFENGDEGVFAEFDGDGTTTLTNTTGQLSGQSALIIDQHESEDIFTASASGTTMLTLGNTGNLTIAGDLTVSGGDVSGSSGENIDLGEINANSIIFQINGTSELGLDSGQLYASAAEGLAIGTASNEFEALYLGDDNGAFFGLDQDWSLGYDEATDDRLELVTSGTSGVLLSSATVTGTGLLATFDSLTTGTGIDLSVDAITQGKGLNISNAANTLTTGTLLNVDSTSTAVTGSSTGLLGYFNWNPGSATTATGDLFRINIGSSGNVDNVFNVTDNGSTLFSVGEAGITSAVPHEFTAAGDVSIAYDIQFTNQTASYVKSYAPLYIQAGEPQESNNLTLQTFNSGDIAFENGDSGTIAVFGGDGTTTITNTSSGASSGKSALIVDQEETEHIFTASASGTTEFVIANDGKVYIGDNTTLGTSTALCWESTTINGATVYQVGDCTGTPADLAEWYPASSTDLPQPGDVVTVGDSLGTYTTNDGIVHNAFSVKKATSEYDPKMIGIMSTKSFQTMGEDVLDWADSAVQVGLVGRVPVKIASTSDAIEPGDFLTSSSEPGRAKKADSDGGYTIAKALEKWTPGSGTDSILAYINASVKLPEVAQNDPLYNDNTNVLTGFNATTSATLAELNVTDLTAFGDTILADTTITGNLNIGTIQFDGFDNSIDAVGTLKLQPLALGDVEIMNGLVTIDTNGNIVAQEVTANKYNVAGASAGTATINSGNSSVFVSTGMVTNDSLIFVTPKKSLSYPLAVTSKNAGNGFTVTIPSSASSNIDFDWFIVDKK